MRQHHNEISPGSENGRSYVAETNDGGETWIVEACEPLPASATILAYAADLTADEKNAWLDALEALPKDEAR